MIKAESIPMDLGEMNTRVVEHWIPFMMKQDSRGRSAESTVLGRIFSWWTLNKEAVVATQTHRQPFTKRGYWQEVLTEGDPFAFVKTDVTPTGNVVVRGSGISRVVPRVHAAFDWLEENEQLQQGAYLARLVITTEFYLHSFWITGACELILPIDPEGSHLSESLRSGRLYTIDEFIGAARAAVEKGRNEGQRAGVR
ncbi:hypothetical protein WMF30_14210 [Sorangium sp. So ce134]